MSYSGRTGRIHFTVDKWAGPIRSGDLTLIKQKEKLPKTGKVKFEGIGGFSHNSGYLFNTGSLLWKEEDWDKVIQAL